MKNAYLLLILFVLCFGQNLNAQSIIKKTLYFNVDEHTLTSSSQEILHELIQELNDANESELQIVGHTDQNGSQKYNMKLSKSRAESVRKFLLENGYVNKDVEISFEGESNLLTKAVDQNSLRLNRRVTVKAIIYNYDSVNDFVSQLALDVPDSILVDQDKEQKISLSKGTIVKFPAHAFCNEDGSPLLHNEVEMVFKEAFDYTKMFDERLATQTADQILETGGMIYMEATQDGVPLRLKEGKEIELIFPEQELKEGMELFTGVETDEGVIWEETGEKIAAKKEEFFIQVDFSPITNYISNFQDTLVFPEGNMPVYPKTIRKPHPPAQLKYNQEQYDKVYEKYELVLAQYYQELAELPEKLDMWNKEMRSRKALLIQHKKDKVAMHVQKWAEYFLAQLKPRVANESHVKLLSELNVFLQRKVGKFKYNDKHYKDKLFAGVTRDHLIAFDVYQPFFNSSMIGEFLPELSQRVRVVQRNVQSELRKKKLESGIVDKQIAASYIVTTTTLGWINCDRFMKLSDYEKMNFHFADATEDKNYYLVFKNIKSVIRPRLMDGGVTFRNLPKGAEVKLVSLGVKNNECYVAAQDLTLGSHEKIDLRYNKSSLKDVRKILEDI